MSAKLFSGRQTVAHSMRMKYLIADICAFSLIFLFVYASTAKLFRFQLFQFQLDSYPWIRHLSGIVSWGVPLAELVIAGLLLSGKRKLSGFYASLFLMILFTVYLIAMVNSGKHLPCSCGGVIAVLTWRQHIWFNLLFIIMAGAGIYAERAVAAGRKNSFFHHHKNQVYET